MVSASGTLWHESNRGISLYICFYLLLFSFVTVLIKHLHDRPRLGAVLPEAAVIILVGIAVGFIVQAIYKEEPNNEDEDLADNVAQSLLSFSPTVFFVVLLPPIIFNSGYHMNAQLFFRYITPICLYACVGTVVCTVVVASLLWVTLPFFSFAPSFLELLAFGALISATDPVSTLAVFSTKRVDPHLFYLVSGESLINDAVGLVLFEALAHLIEFNQNEKLNVGQEIMQFLVDFALGFCGSLVLGTFFGLGMAYGLKVVDLRHTLILELGIYGTIMYFPFVLAEICHLSGIVTVLFTGIASKRYAEPNLSSATKENADTLFRLVAHLTETMIFLELGLNVAGLVGLGAVNVGFIGFALVACFVGRALNIYPITFLFNLGVRYRQDRDSQREDGIVLPSEASAYVMEATDANDDIVARASLARETSEQILSNDAEIPWKTAHMLWFSGLRGAVSYGLVKTFPATANQITFVVTTMFIVLITTFVLGGTTEIALKALKIPMQVDEIKYLEGIEQKKLLPGWLRRFEEYQVRRWVIRDFFTNQAPGELDYHEHIELTEIEHLENVKKQALYDYGQ